MSIGSRSNEVDYLTYQESLGLVHYFSYVLELEWL